MEIWKPVDCADGVYEVSSRGRVRSKTRMVQRTGGSPFLVHGRQMQLSYDSRGYARVTLVVGGRHKTFPVHRLVALAFLPLKDGRNCVNHKDFNPSNNSVENLEWVTHAENMRYSFDLGRFERTASWREHLKKSLDEKMATPVVSKNVETGEERYFRALNDVKNFGFQPSCVCNCCKGKRGTHAGFYWRYAEEDWNAQRNKGNVNYSRD